MSSKRRRQRQFDVEELNVTPLMNLFVAIVPLLLLSAVFVSLSSIDLSAPTRSEQPQTAVDDFVLAVRVTGKAWWVDAADQGSVKVERGDTEALWRILDRQQQAHPGHSSVLVACDASVAYHEVVQVLDTAALAGFPDCALLGAETAAASTREDG